MKYFFLILISLSLFLSKLPYYLLDPSLTTISGLSSGGYMAVQMHFAFSSIIKGASIFAGGPYFCAQSNALTATTACMSTPSLIPLQALILEAETLKNTFLIDNLTNLEGQKVFLFSGSADSIVHQGVMDNLAVMYGYFGVEIQKNFKIPAQHAFPTDGYGNLCGTLGEPYINNCNYNGAYETFKALYGDNIKTPVVSIKENLLEFDQSDYLEFGSSLNDKGYIYVPDSCQKKEKCGLHVVFHGCKQTLDDISLDFVTHTGYNDVAEANNFIILYPQAKRSDLLPINLEGCWDWWGYTDSLLTIGRYVTKEGVQMSAIAGMMKDLGLDGDLNWDNIK